MHLLNATPRYGMLCSLRIILPPSPAMCIDMMTHPAPGSYMANSISTSGSKNPLIIHFAPSKRSCQTLTSAMERSI